MPTTRHSLASVNNNSEMIANNSLFMETEALEAIQHWQQLFVLKVVEPHVAFCAV